MVVRWFLRIGLDENNGVQVEGPISRERDCVALLAGAILEVQAYNKAQEATRVPPPAVEESPIPFLVKPE